MIKIFAKKYMIYVIHTAMTKKQKTVAAYFSSE